MSMSTAMFSKIVSACMKALTQNYKIECLIQQYMIDTDDEREKFMAEAKTFTGVSRLSLRVFVHKMKTKKLTDETFMELKQLYTNVLLRNSNLRNKVSEFRDHLNRETSKQGLCQTPTCPVAVMYRDFPDLLKQQQTESQPLTALCDLILDKYHLDIDPMFSEGQIDEKVSDSQVILKQTETEIPVSVKLNSMEGSIMRKDVQQAPKQIKFDTPKKATKSTSASTCTAVMTRVALPTSASTSPNNVTRVALPTSAPISPVKVTRVLPRGASTSPNNVTRVALPTSASISPAKVTRVVLPRGASTSPANVKRVAMSTSASISPASVTRVVLPKGASTSPNNVTRVALPTSASISPASVTRVVLPTSASTSPASVTRVAMPTSASTSPVNVTRVAMPTSASISPVNMTRVAMPTSASTSPVNMTSVGSSSRLAHVTYKKESAAQADQTPTSTKAPSSVKQMSKKSKNGSNTIQQAPKHVKFNNTPQATKSEGASTCHANKKRIAMPKTAPVSPTNLTPVAFKSAAKMTPVASISAVMQTVALASTNHVAQHVTQILRTSVKLEKRKRQLTLNEGDDCGPPAKRPRLIGCVPFAFPAVETASYATPAYQTVETFYCTSANGQRYFQPTSGSLADCKRRANMELDIPAPPVKRPRLTPPTEPDWAFRIKNWRSE